MIPRRSYLHLSTREEMMIRDCIVAVEQLGASVELTNCVSKLADARNHLSNHIDKQLEELHAAREE